MASFNKTYTPPWVWLTIFLGLLPAAILAAVVSTKHWLTVPYCRRCNTRRRFAPLVGWVLGIAAIVVLFVAIGFAVSGESWVPFAGGLLAIVLIGIAGDRYHRSAHPRFITFDANNVVIQDAVHGPVVLVARPPGYVAPNSLNF